MINFNPVLLIVLHDMTGFLRGGSHFYEVIIDSFLILSE